MSDHNLTEDPLCFGEGGRLFGILTQPGKLTESKRDLPVFIFLSAGLVHRTGPRRLYVRISRELAEIGFTSLRVDLAGKGDSISQPYLATEESLTEDYKDIVSILESRLGKLEIILAGLCSGADDAIRLASNDSRVVGMMLLDPVCERDEGFKTRDVVRKFTHLGRYQRRLEKSIKDLVNPTQDSDGTFDHIAMRNSPNHLQLRSAFRSIRERQGRVFSLFTSYAEEYYNQRGQMGRVLDLDTYQEFCTELFWPGSSHTYSLELHQSQLIEEIKTWAAGYS